MSCYLQVNGFEVDKMKLQKETSAITSKLVEAKVTVCELEEENVSRSYRRKRLP